MPRAEGGAAQARAIFINKNAFKSNKKLVLFLSWPKLSRNGGLTEPLAGSRPGAIPFAPLKDYAKICRRTT
jgi:hypothetical protein